MRHTVDLAREFAIYAHYGQYYGGSQYSKMDHVHQVVGAIDELYEKQLAEKKGQLIRLGSEQAYTYFVNDIITVAFLHDVVEDTVFNLETIVEIFGKNIGMGVDLCTDGAGNNRKERKRNWKKKWTRIKDADKTADDCYQEIVAGIVKAADRYCNIAHSVAEGHTNLLKMYKKEHDEFTDIVRNTMNAHVLGMCWKLLENVE